FIAFSVAPFPTWGPLLAAAALASLWRDGYTYPSMPTAHEAATDGFFVGTFILLSQVLLLLPAGSWTVPPAIFLRGLPTGMIRSAGWRFSFRIGRPDRGPLRESYLSAWRLTALWLAGAVALSAGNKNMFLTEGHLRDFLIGLSPMPFSLGIRLQ